MVKKQKGKSVKKAKAGVALTQEEDYKKFPHSMVFHRGNVGKNISDLEMDMRRVMEPFTATNLKARKNNVLKDFVNVAGPMNISHFIIFTKTQIGNYLRILRVPRGPTLTFKIEQYCLSRDIVTALKRPTMDQKQFQHHPLLVMNSFSGEGMHFKLMATMFQNLFPSINVNKVKLGEIRRCVLLNYTEDDSIEFRHYNVKAVPVGMSRAVKKLVKSQIPDLAKYLDVSEYLLRTGDLSESEAELDGPHNEVTVPPSLAQGRIKSAKSAIRLTEIGPRMTLRLVKIEEGLSEGEVLYHSLVNKTDEEKELLRKKRTKKKKLKESRKKQQEENVKRKEQQKADQKEKSLAGMQKAEKNVDFEEVETPETPVDPTRRGHLESDSDDDIDYYRKEVGAEPEPELFPKKRKSSKSRGPPEKRQKSDKKPNQKPHKDGKNKSKEEGAKKGGQKKQLTEFDKIKRRKVKKQKEKLKKSGKNKGQFKHAKPRKR